MIKICLHFILKAVTQIDNFSVHKYSRAITYVLESCQFLCPELAAWPPLDTVIFFRSTFSIGGVRWGGLGGARRGWKGIGEARWGWVGIGGAKKAYHTKLAF
jgi:hypothetical protein